MKGTLYFEKISRYERRGEPVTMSIPFDRGKLEDPSHLAILDPDSGRFYAHQSRILARWPDGSAKWLLTHFQPDLPGNADKTLEFEVQPQPTPVSIEQSASVKEEEGGLRVETGPLSFLVRREGYLPVSEVSLKGTDLSWSEPFKGFSMLLGSEDLATGSGPVALEVEEGGPLRVVILVRGKHRRADGSGYTTLCGRITAYAGKPYIEVEHQFVHDEAEEQLPLRSLTFSFRPERGERTPRLAIGEGYYQTRTAESDEHLDKIIDAETILYQSNEHFVDCFYGDFWADWRDERGGLCLSLYQAHQNFPKKLQADHQGIVCSLYPEEAEPAPVFRGMGKTHRLMLHFHAPDVPLQELCVRSLQFQLPDVPILPRSWYRENNPWLEAYFPERIPNRLMTRLLNMHDGRPQAMGMFHFGDAPDAGYTNQGRGRGESVWVNNEYDRPHNCALFYGLSGQRRVLDSGLTAARHWLDVDLCKYDPDPLIHGGLKIHTRYHVTGGVTPSHEWTEGLLDYYFLTGRREGLEAAISVGENIMRHMARPEMRTPGEASVREGGWALRAMIGLYLGTGEERWKEEARRLVDMYLDWREQYGGLLAPYTSHSMPRVTFMISLTVVSFARYLFIEDDPRVVRLIVDTVDDLLEHCMGPDGLTYYKELPSLRRSAPDQHICEALTWAYRLTGNRRYLEIAARQFAAIMERDLVAKGTAKRIDSSGAVVAGEGGARIFSTYYTAFVLFAGAATPLGLLEWFEYPY